jgi:type VI secretion system protein ImpL
MKKIFGWLVNRWFLTALALLTISLLIWWLGPLISIGSVKPLDTELSRAITIGVLLLLVVLRAVYLRWKLRKASLALTDGLVKSEKSSTVVESVEQVQLKERFTEAVAALRKMRRHAAGKRPGFADWLSISSGSYLYDLPWYMFIGPPGSGKTTALVNSGLPFPLAEKFGKGAIKGIGGTRNCDWWFTEDAVLIDTAGRYTTQDSSAADDKTAWDGFLQLLKKSRPRRPLNGIFLSVSVSDLLQKGSSERQLLAEAIRARLSEIDATLAIRIPVYVIVTKADLLHGFSEYFADLGKEQRAQVWGFTLPIETRADKDTLRPLLDLQLSLLGDRISGGVVSRMQQEPDASKRAAIFGFSAQFSALCPALTDVLDQVFIGTKFTQPPFVRGVYFSSATQEGSPIDRVVAGLARTFSLGRQSLPTQSSSGRSFFLTTLLKDLVFSEQNLATGNVAWERKQTLLRRVGVGSLSLLSVGLLTAWGVSAYRNVNYLQAVEAGLNPIKTQLQSLPVASIGLLDASPVVNLIGTSWIATDVKEVVSPVSMGWGLFQGEKIQAAAQGAYLRSLNEALVPAVTKRIEDQLRTAQKDNLEFSYEALKAYLMLYQPEHFDAEAIKAWVTLDWARTLDRGIKSDKRELLEEQIDLLLSQGPLRPSVPMDENLVKSVRAMLASFPLEQRIFSRIRRQKPGGDTPGFSIAKAAGPSAQLVFERASGKPLTEGVSGWFTYDGYHKRFQMAVAQVTPILVKEEPWVLGLDRNLTERLKDAAAVTAVTDRVRRIFLDSYVKEWDRFIADIRLVRATSVERNIEMARILSGAASPLGGLVKGIAREVTLLSVDNSALGKAGSSVAGAVGKAADTLNSTRKGLEDLFGGDPQKSANVGLEGGRIESIVDDHFLGLRKLVEATGPNQPSPLDGSLKLFDEVYVYLNAVDAAVKSKSAPPPGDTAGKIKGEAGRLPEPIRSMIESLSQTGLQVAKAAELNNLSQDLKPIADFCNRAIAGRYPLVESASRDVLPDDFGQMFGPGGLMDDFFQKRLANLVDTSTQPWRFKPVGEGGKVTAQALAQFEKAARIKEVFFRGGGRTPTMRLDFKPLELDDSITQFILDVDGQIVKYAHGPIVPMAVQWPATKGSNQVRLQISPIAASGSSGQTTDGPWALFRTLDKARLEGGGAPEKFIATFNIDNRKARFEVTANSVQHPIRLRELQSFACPGGL